MNIELFQKALSKILSEKHKANVQINLTKKCKRITKKSKYKTI